MPGQKFYKMSGSGNDFIFFDENDGATRPIHDASKIQSLCARGTGVGADGVVFFNRSVPGSVSIDYYNSDGSVGELCGNATLCTVRLNEILGARTNGDLKIKTGAGEVPGRLVDGIPEIDLEPVSEVHPAWPAIEPQGTETRLGYVVVGVPHVSIEVPNIASVDVLGRGSRVRRDRSLPKGANVNFLAPRDDGAWSIRTYERGVEGETLACGTGAVASAILLVSWARSSSPVRLVTKSGGKLVVTLREESGTWYPSLRGGAELVFVGELPTWP